ncbi:MAG: hypothetical protein MUD01_13065, partial [Chloroflexaceae bacterium]|nr:hypothetical protein [Chloroflexaceae bacterium]
MEHEISVIRHQLHCNAINIYGSDADRLLASAAFALSQGLHVWLQPRLVDGTIDATIALVSEVAQRAEVLRRRFGHLTLIVGGEFSLTSAGMVPGASLDERVINLTSSFTDMEGLNHNLNAMLQHTLVATRAVFKGAVTYASGSWEAVDWHDFDIVAVNLYRDAANHASYRDELRQRQQWGKPLVITEFGCCAYQGADQAGSMGFDV